MNYLLDTNVVSDALKPRPDRNVSRWLDTIPEDFFYLSVLTLGEIRKGVELLPASVRRDRIDAWLAIDLARRFEGRLLAVDTKICDRWGRLLAAAQRTVSAVDALIAATALTYDLTLLTRNVRDFAFPGLRAVDPFGTKPPS